jgi:beta-glucosidase
MAAAMSRGLSGPDPKRLLTASLLKHFLSNSNEVGRENGSSDYDARLYHEYYAEPFRRAVQEGGAQGLMAAYNGYNGIPCAVHPMLRAVLRQQWGHDGIICTDGGAYTMLVTKHRLFHSKDEAAAACIKAGINQFLDEHPRGTRGALHKGLLTDADLDDALAGVFRVMLRLGQLDAPSEIAARQLPAATPNPCHSQAHQALALEAVIKSAVLLKNDGLLPLAPSALKRVAVIGPHADEVIADWYGGDPPLRVSPLQGLRERLKGAEVLGHDGKDRAAAAKLAASCDAAIVLIGNHPLGHGGWDKVDSVLEAKECIDRQDLALRDEDLYQAVLKAQAKSVLVIVSSFPVACNASAKNAPAILHLTHSGQAQGTGLAALLCGDANPGGKLSQTWPTGIEQLPPMRDYDLRRGRTYLYSKHKPLFAFGHGLSYTRFELGAAKLAAPAIKAGGKLSLSVELANTGSHDGDEVLQLYVRWTGSKIDRPIRALKAFQRISVPKGQKRTAELVLHADDLRHWDEAKHAWALEAGSLELELGTGSDAIQQRLKLEVQA